MSQQPIEHHFRARIRPLDLRQVEALDLPEDIENPFVFTTESSNNNLDFYFTHMTERTLRNYAADARAGVQFLDSHNNRNLGYGRTFDGRFEIIEGQAPAWDLDGRAVELAIEPPAQYMRTLIETFTVPGINFGGGLTYASTDDFIRAARAGIARDISIGFYGGDWTCDICGGNYRRYDACPHLAGFEYPVGEQGERSIIATVAIDGAHLAEHSAVYDGATPQAMIIKAERMAQAGEMEPEKIRLFEQRYKINLPHRRSFAGADVNGSTAAAQDTAAQQPVGDEHMNEQEMLDAVRAALAEAGINEAVPVDGGVRQLAERLTAAQTAVEDARAAVPQGVEGATLAEQVRALAGELARLRPLADDGRAYRSDLIDQAIAEGVRAHGDEFAVETYRGLLGQSELDVIKRMRDDWAKLAGSRFPGGRLVEDEETEPEQRDSEDLVPDEAYAA